MIFAQITDLHVGHKLSLAGGEVDPLAQVKRVIVHLSTLKPAVDLILLTGDLSETGAIETYMELKEVLQAATMPVFLIPGNHDDKDNLRMIFDDHGYLTGDDEFLHFVIEGYPLRLLGLDTLIPGEEGGCLCSRRLAWFEARLAEAPATPTLVFMHHPPCATGLSFFDRMRFRGGDEMGVIIARHSQVAGVICGHVHRAIHVRWCGTVVSTAPSVSFQYPLEFDSNAAVEPVLEPPAYRLYVWRPEVGLLSHLSYVDSARVP